MNAVVQAPASVPKRTPRSRLGRLLGSSIGLKIVMAATGVILSGFVLGHMLGNLQVFQGAKALDAYAKLLRVEPALLWGARAVLLASVGLHIWAWIALNGLTRSARSEAYRVVKRREADFASLSMRFTGPLVLAFIVYHILHLTTGTVHPDYHEGLVYQNLVSGLKVVPVAVFYLLGMAALGFHLWHGVWSLFQTLGVGQSRHRSLGRQIATAFTLLVVLGFAAVPVAVLAGIIK